MATQKIRLIQTGDWHLFANQSDWEASGFQCREARLQQCLRTIFEAAKDADFLALTGDLVELTSIGTNDARLASLDRQIKLLGREKVIVAYGSHDDQSVREWFSLRTAHRTQLTLNVYTMEYPSHGLIFYAVDSDFKDSRSQGSIMKEATRVILNDRTKNNGNFSRAVLVTQLSEKDIAQLQPLRGCINYVALGDHHFARLLTNRRPFSAYSGAPVARDACTEGDSGKRWFVEVGIDYCGHAAPKRISLSAGGCQVKVKSRCTEIILINGPGPENKHVLKIQDSQELPIQIVEKINEITARQWTSIALADSVPNQWDILNYIKKNYQTSMNHSFYFSTSTKNGAMYYFVRSERME